jgi:hypothetical protein
VARAARDLAHAFGAADQTGRERGFAHFTTRLPVARVAPAQDPVVGHRAGVRAARAEMRRARQIERARSAHGLVGRLAVDLPLEVAAPALQLAVFDQCAGMRAPRAGVLDAFDRRREPGIALARVAAAAAAAAAAPDVVAGSGRAGVALLDHAALTLGVVAPAQQLARAGDRAAVVRAGRDVPRATAAALRIAHARPGISIVILGLLEAILMQAAGQRRRAAHLRVLARARQHRDQEREQARPVHTARTTEGDGVHEYTFRVRVSRNVYS